MTGFSRRRFLATSGALMAGAPVLSARFAPQAFAADTSGYKALVCIFLYGGLDATDTVLPYDQTNYDRLAALRAGLFDAYGTGSGNSSRDRENLLEIIPDNAADFGSRRFALPPEMSGMRDMFDDGDLAIVGNVGPLIEPTDQTAFLSETVSVPERLFSHNDQQSTWMSFGVEGSQFGWGGRFADVIGSAGDPLFTSIGYAGNDVFLSGEDIRPFLTSAGYGQDINATMHNWYTGYGEDYDRMRDRLNAFYGRNDFGHQNLLKMDYGNISAQGIANVRAFNQNVQSGNDYEGQFPDTRIGEQLQSVAQVISAKGSFATPRQIFYVGIGGFDTHSDQSRTLPSLLGQLSDAVSAFRDAMVSANDWNNVRLFTASDFGRTIVDNGDGTDHGWGGHHFVAGGDVNGRRIYGTLPPPILGGSQFIPEGSQALIPTVSVDEYAASLGGWFGLTPDEMSPILPNLNNFAGGLGSV